MHCVFKIYLTVSFVIKLFLNDKPVWAIPRAKYELYTFVITVMINLFTICTSKISNDHAINSLTSFGQNLSNFWCTLKPGLNDLTLLYNICLFNNVEKPAKRFHISKLLAEMFDGKQNTQMLNTRHQTWGAKQMMYSNVRSFSQGLSCGTYVQYHCL